MAFQVETNFWVFLIMQTKCPYICGKLKLKFKNLLGRFLFLFVLVHFFLLGEREKERKVEWGRENMIKIHFMEISFSKII